MMRGCITSSLTMCSGQGVVIQREMKRKKSVWSRISGINPHNTQPEAGQPLEKFLTQRERRRRRLTRCLMEVAVIDLINLGGLNLLKQKKVPIVLVWAHTLLNHLSDCLVSLLSCTIYLRMKY